MDKQHYTLLQKKWAKVGRHKLPSDFNLDIELYKKMLSIFQVGKSYYFVFVPPLGTIEYISNSISSVLGYQPEEFNVDLFLNSIHPDDFPYFMDFEVAVVDFKMKLPKEKVMKYKSQYNYRIKHKNGKYLQILQQSITVQSNEEGAALRNLVVHTNINHLKFDQKKTLSFIGLEGEPSYYNVEFDKKFIAARNVLTPRELEIIELLAQGKNSKEISNILCISQQTVRTHRRNIHLKVGSSSTIELVMLAKDKGWI